MTVETSEYLSAAGRFIRAAGRRCAEADEPELVKLVALKDEVDEAVRVAVAGWYAAGKSWTDIGRALGISRQAARQRFTGGRPDGVVMVATQPRGPGTPRADEPPQGRPLAG